MPLHLSHYGLANIKILATLRILMSKKKGGGSFCHKFMTLQESHKIRFVF